MSAAQTLSNVEAMSDLPHKSEVPPPSGPASSDLSRRKWELLAWLWLAFFLNQGDRQIYNVVLPLISADLGLDAVKLGLIATLFTAIYGVLVPAAGYVGDITNRKWMVFTSLAVFSAGTLLTGLASGFLLLLIFRSIATGAGEAFYYPAANALLGEAHRESRARAMAIHQTANYTGVVVSGVVAAWIGERWGWRASFYTFGVAGIVLAVLTARRLPTSPASRTSAAENASLQVTVPLREACAAVFGKPTVLLLALAFGGMVFVHVGYLTWMPTYLKERFALSLTEAGFSAVFYHHALAYLGVLLGGWLSDRWARRRERVRLEIEALGLLLGAPFIFLMGHADRLAFACVALAGFGFFRGLYDSNLMAAPFDVVPSRCHASASGLILAFGFLIGSLAPLVLGVLKERLGLGAGLSSLSLVYLLSAALVWTALRFTFARDFRAARSSGNS